MKILSINVNGLRAFDKKKGLAYIVKTYNPDIICMQEIKCLQNDASRISKSHGYVCYCHSNTIKKGYAGVAILVKRELKDLVLGHEQVKLMSDPYALGRIIRVDFADYSLYSVYAVNSGNKKQLRREWDKEFRDYMNNSKPKIIMGDLNVCHTALDHHDWVNSLNTMPGLMEFEIEGFSKLLDECHLIDVYRYFNPTSKSYTWYPNFNTAALIAKNKGWRLDYALISQDLEFKVTGLDHFNSLKDRYSDHLPIQLILKQ